MTRSWRAQIADEVRAASMSGPKGKTIKYLRSKTAHCSECQIEWTGRFCERDAKRHACETGHTVSVEALFDISPVMGDHSND